METIEINYKYKPQDYIELLMESLSIMMLNA